MIGLIDDLFIHGEDAAPVDHIVELFSVLDQPNYLGSPVVVRELLQAMFTEAVLFAKGESSYAGLQEALAITAHHFARDESYTRITGWHCVEGLGRTLIRLFLIHEPPEALEGVILEALFALFLKARDLVLAFESDPAADWHSHALPQLNALHEWAVTVFLGSSDVLHPGMTLADFAWQMTPQ